MVDRPKLARIVATTGVMAALMSITLAFLFNVVLRGVLLKSVGEWLRAPTFVAGWFRFAVVAYVMAWPAALIFFPVAKGVVSRLPLPRPAGDPEGETPGGD